jgi:hypothetical protein
MKFQLSAFSLFLILLIILFLSYFIGYWFPENTSTPTTKENFISFNYGASLGSSVQIPQYSGNNPINKVAKVYDNVFYDVYNGNLIEVDSSIYKGNSEVTGNSISKIHILNRTNNTTANSIVTYNTTATIQTKESQYTFTNSFKEFVYKTQGVNTDPYVVFYLPWSDSTYLHMINISGGIQNHQHTVTELYHQTSQNSIKYNNSFLKFVSGKNMDDFNASNNNFVRLPSYDPSYSIFQMSSNIFFDVRNAQVIITNPDTNSIVVYPRKYDMTDSSLIKSGSYTTQTSVINTDFNTWTTYDLSNKGNKMVLYISVSTKTMVVIIEPDNNNGYRIFNIKRFTNTGLDNGQPFVNVTTSSNTDTKPATPNSMMSDYYEWFYHTTVKGIQDPNSHNFKYSDDYMLKTQIVPPVCPSCPSCPSGSGTCTNCGGNGGSGTQGPKGQNLVAGQTNTPGQPISNTVTAVTGTVNNAVNTTGNLLYAGASGTKDLLQDTASGVGNFAKDTASGVGGFLKDTASGVGGFAKDTASGVGNFTKDTASGVGNFTKDTASGVGNFAKDTASGVGNFAKSVGNGITSTSPTDVTTINNTTKNNNRNFNDNDINRIGYQNASGGPVIQTSSVTDPYSYFGAIPAKPSNYMPITTDFSKFGR